jgi:hypothetical protein
VTSIGEQGRVHRSHRTSSDNGDFHAGLRGDICGELSNTCPMVPQPAGSGFGGVDGPKDFPPTVRRLVPPDLSHEACKQCTELISRIPRSEHLSPERSARRSGVQV